MENKPNTQNLIHNLTQKLTPTTPLPHPLIKAAQWLILITFYLASLLFIFEFRPDITQKISNLLFIIDISSALLLAYTATIAASYLTLPDAYQQHWITYIPFAPLCMLIIVLCIRLLGYTPIDDPTYGPVCSRDIALFAIAPTILLAWHMKQGAPTQSILGSTMIGLAVTSIGYAVLRMVEANDYIIHILLWHIMPMILITASYIIFGRKIFTW